MTLAPEPPEIYRHGPRRRGGLQVEPIFILGGTTYAHDLYGDNSSSVQVRTGSLQIIGGEQGLIATIDAWEYQPLSTLGGVDIGITGALAGWNATESEFYVTTLASSAESQASTICEFPAAFIDGDKLHILITRQRVLFQRHTLHWVVYYSDGSGGVIGQGTKDREGAVRSVADVLHIEVDLIDKSVTYAKQDCFSASLTLTSMHRYGADDHALDYDLECSTQSIVGFLAGRTGLDSDVFSVDHSPGATWTYSADNRSGYATFFDNVGITWADANSAKFNLPYIPGPDVFMPWGRSARYRKEYWSNGFINWPGWLGLNRDAGYVLAGDLSNQVVEISTFDSDVDSRYWGRSSLSGYIGSTQLLDAEEIFSINYLDDDDQARIIGGPTDPDNLPSNGAKQGVPLDWPDTAADASAPIEPQYFWSNAETLKAYIYAGAEMVLYRVTD